MSRAPLRHAQGRREAFAARSNEIFDTTIGWRFVNPLMRSKLRRRLRCRRPPKTSPPTTSVSRADQDAFALRSQQRAGKAHGGARFFAPRSSAGAKRAGRQGRADHRRQATSIRAPETTLDSSAS